ncbi:MAG: oxidoreductase [Deltaproteobacteria bacterium]|nr:MAG: oxidoreductase [Deltaproteobacteria bacterium]
MKTFNAMVVSENTDGSFSRAIQKRTIDDLPDGDVLVRVKYSSLNYKDALSASGNRGVTKKYPHTPGIDAAGVVETSADSRFSPGDEVIVTSYDLGMDTAGGFGEYIRVPAGWVIPLPKGFSLKESMMYGTAGLTAAMSVDALIDGGITPDRGEVLVTGASGGVGSIAVSILHKLGYSVAGVSGKTDESDYLKSLGVGTVLSIEEATDTSGRPMLKPRWAGCIDTVGGDIMSTAIKSVKPFGVLVCCGNAAGPNLDITVYPFILRALVIVGIDSQDFPMDKRLKAWNKLASDWKLDGIQQMVQEAPLSDVDGIINEMLAGRHKGRTVISLG